MTARGCFVTGTDTGIGKTWVSVGLMEWFKARGRRVAGMKPVASGCELVGDKLRNEDALLLQSHASMAVSYDDVNPFAFAPPIAPHIAAEQEGRPIRLEDVLYCYSALAADADYVVVEGVGGWEVPLNDGQSVADMAAVLGLPVLLVVGIKLGCINHAMLSMQAIRRSGLVCIGWVANCVDPECMRVDDVIGALESRLGAPLMGIVPYLAKPDFTALASHLDCACLLGQATR